MNARSVRRPVRRWAEPAARVGHTAKGLVYIAVGGLAARAALGWGGRPTDTRGALLAVDRQRTVGDILLLLIAAGLLAYTFWRLAQAWLDLDRKGGEPRGVIVRLGYAAAGLVYAGLALTAVQLALGGDGGGRSDGLRAWTARVLADPDRWWLVAAAGLTVLGAGAYQFYKGYTGSFVERLRLGSLSPAGRSWVRRVGVAGLSARGVTFAVIGWLLLRAATEVDPGQARGLAGALALLRRHEHGDWLLGGVGLGLVAYGVFSVVEGRYRQIR